CAQKRPFMAGLRRTGITFCQTPIHLPTRATPAGGQKAKMGVLGQALTSSLVGTKFVLAQR
ncbi:MAG: hypothetical protein WCI17_06200, partial [bacterium]